MRLKLYVANIYLKFLLAIQLNLCLTSTYSVQYNGKHYKQLHGTAMGPPVSVVAEIAKHRGTSPSYIYTKSSLFGHDICLKGRLDTFSTFSAFKIHNSVSLWVKITKKPNGIGRPSWCSAPKQSSNSATGCDVINRWIIGIRYQAPLESCPPPPRNVIIVSIPNE